MYSAVLMDKARMVHVAFLSDCCTCDAPSTTNRFLQSCDWHHLFNTDFCFSFPILVVPTSCIILPGASSPHISSGPCSGDVVIAPISCMILVNVSCMCFAWLISSLFHL